ncbi:hypothetical protein AVEN_100832-1 [Araneus ventricosus]|uniref:Uncharacterized protein n=1 Tax=Araneus ventricosus TaxID=182803 RepID=A0A4Y2AYK6_ARAVE|nr:hypothetical protein AVEN_100832-1 [Araneus ventricosus]
MSHDGCISTSFITAKSRVASLKKLTLPGLELMGAVIAARILRYLKEQLPFASNRVIEIQSNTDPACPEDYISREASAERLMNSSIWIHGPEWLRKEEENWPKGCDCKISLGESGERRIIQDEI